MASRRLDVLFVNPSSAQVAYQELSKEFAAIEPPTWALLLAQSCRSAGYGVAILDCDAERLTLDAAVRRIRDADARLVCFVVYGQNPNSGTTSMIGATALCDALKQQHPGVKTCFVGSHTSALPREVLAHSSVDFVLLNEGVYALRSLLKTDLVNGLPGVRGIGFKDPVTRAPVLNRPEAIVPQERMDIDLPGYAWDLLPYRSKPLDLYRAHFWHAGFDPGKRTPFAAIYTSLGCRFACDFCMINILNRTDNGDEVSAANSKGMRYWSAPVMLKEFEKLAAFGVETLRISDEMFFLDKRHYEPLLNGIRERGLRFRMWSYARVDTVRQPFLELFKSAGVDWLCLGIEAARQTVRKEISKGTFAEVDIGETVREVRDAGIHVLGNYMFGLPDDTADTMQDTLDLAMELNTEHANFYPCQALPGSPLYFQAKKNGWRLPDSYAGYAFLSYECLPLPTKHLAAEQVLRFRDEGWKKYFTNPRYLDMVERTFGPAQRRNVEKMAAIRLKRKILGD